jgi:predicted enzyme involved in methoxymalonyl-ACP biosynthesis
MLRTTASFSLTGERPFLQDEEIERMLQDKDCLLISVADRLAEYGPTGFVLFHVTGKDLIVEAMALSCLVLGKQAEFATLSALARHAAGQGLARIVFQYKAAPRNQPMQEFLEAIAVSEPALGYAVNVADIEDKINQSAVNPGAWTLALQSSHDDSGVLPSPTERVER